MNKREYNVSGVDFFNIISFSMLASNSPAPGRSIPNRVESWIEHMNNIQAQSIRRRVNEGGKPKEKQNDNQGRQSIL